MFLAKRFSHENISYTCRGKNGREEGGRGCLVFVFESMKFNEKF